MGALPAGPGARSAWERLRVGSRKESLDYTDLRTQEDGNEGARLDSDRDGGTAGHGGANLGSARAGGGTATAGLGGGEDDLESDVGFDLIQWALEERGAGATCPLTSPLTRTTNS